MVPKNHSVKALLIGLSYLGKTGVDPHGKQSFPLVEHDVRNTMLCQDFLDGGASLNVLDDLEFLLRCEYPPRFLLTLFHIPVSSYRPYKM